MRQSGIGAANRRRNTWVLTGQTAYMRLVNHRFAPGFCGRFIIAPVEIPGDDDRFRRDHSAVFIVRCVSAAGKANIVMQHTVNGPCTGINQHFFRVKTMAIFRVERPVNAVTVTLSGFGVGQKTVPQIAGAPR